MEFQDEDIVASYLLEDGSKYVFLANEMIYKQKKDGSYEKIEANKDNMKKIEKDIGKVITDVIL